jgi:hypothetical protein
MATSTISRGAPEDMVMGMKATILAYPTHISGAI